MIYARLFGKPWLKIGRMLEYFPYSPDLVPCDFGLFSLMKEKLKGWKFSSDEGLLAAWDQIYADQQKSGSKFLSINLFV